MSEWISVEDRLPENGFYLCYYRCKSANDTAILCADYLFVWVIPDDAKVTHWMPLPEPPCDTNEQ